MNTIATKNFGIKPLVAAVALAFAPIAAQAAPTPLQMPGAGLIQAVKPSATVNGLGAGGAVTNLTTGATITLAGVVNPRAVIQWGGPGTTGLGEVLNPPGFNIGAAATLNVSTAVGFGVGALLNIDASGSMSQIFGTLNSSNAVNGFTQIFIANANGVMVAPTGKITSPYGIGLIGADLGTGKSVAVNEFVGNNGTSHAYLDVATTSGPVVVAGTINGDPILNQNASFILLAGNDVTNTGNLFGGQVDLIAGLGAGAGTATVNAVTGVTVNRLWDVDFAVGPNLLGQLAVSGNVGCGSGCLALSSKGGTGSAINTGSISSSGVSAYLPLGSVRDGAVNMFAANNVTNGTPGDKNQTIGVFSDGGLTTDTYSGSGLTGLYNVIEAYTFGNTLPFLRVNQQTGAAGDVTVFAITEGANPSTIVVANDVKINGGIVNIASTINKQTGVNDLSSLTVNGSKAVTISADVGAETFVNITSAGPLLISGNVTSDTNKGGNGGTQITNTGAGATTTISGNLVSTSQPDTGFPASDITVTVNGPLTISGNVTAVNAAANNGSSVIITDTSTSSATISGNVTAWTDVDITADLTISGNLVSLNHDINVTNPGTGPGVFTTISGTMNAFRDVNVSTLGTLTMSNTVTAGRNVVVTNGGAVGANTTTISGNVNAGRDIDISNAPFVTGILNISGALNAMRDVDVTSAGNLQLAAVTAGRNIDIEVGGTSSMLSGAMTAGNDFFYAADFATTKLKPAAVITADEVDLSVLNFVGVNSSGNNFVSAAEKGTDVSQIVTNDLQIEVRGSMNAPIAGNTNWVLNGMVVSPQSKLSPTFTSITADGGAIQAINLRFTGDAVVDSGDTITPYQNIPLSSGFFGGGGLVPNAGSSMILNAAGSLFIEAGTGGGNPFFQFPGGLAFLGGPLVQIDAPVYNAFTTNAVPFQGVWVQVTGGAGAVINALSYFATNGNAWVNFNQQPSTAGPFTGPTVYQIESTGSPIPTLFGFVDVTASALHQNKYTSAILGNPVNTCPVSICGWGPPL